MAPERHHSAASGGKLQVDPPYFEHGGCSAVAGFGRSLLWCQQACASSHWRLQAVKRLGAAPFAAPTISPVLRTCGPDNSAVRRNTHI